MVHERDLTNNIYSSQHVVNIMLREHGRCKMERLDLIKVAGDKDFPQTLEI